VYNVEVHGSHVYRVGDQGILVHNASTVREDACKQLSDEELRKSVIEIHRAFSHFLAKTLRTTALAILRDKDGNLLCAFSVSQNFLTPEVAKKAQEFGFTVYIAGKDHAERNILEYAMMKCLVPVAIIPCRPACGPEKRDCERAVRESGARLVNPLPNAVGETDRCKHLEE
jgi:hypothetical protein